MRGARLFACWFGLAAAALLALAWWQGQAYWEYSDGIYSLSARQLLDGQALYGDFAAAQPPPLYYLAAAALSVSDSPVSIRVLMALCEAVVSLLVLVAVRRLTRSSAVALCAAAVCFVTPWALREHAQLLPETLAAARHGRGARRRSSRHERPGGRARSARGRVQARVRHPGAGDRAAREGRSPRRRGVRRRRPRLGRGLRAAVRRAAVDERRPRPNADRPRVVRARRRPVVAGRMEPAAARRPRRPRVVASKCERRS